MSDGDASSGVGGSSARGRPGTPHAMRIVIFTTAAPPWMTGTSINPLFRAAQLASAGHRVTLFFPWVGADQQGQVFPLGLRFASPEEQLAWIQRFFSPAFVENLTVAFYPGRYVAPLGIFPDRGLSRIAPPSDILVLEEPEHLLFFQPQEPIHEKHGRVVGIVHTNYPYYVESIFGESVHASLTPLLNRYLGHLASSACHQTICLSNVLDAFPGAIYANVNGVDPRFLTVAPLASPSPRPFYFMGKTIWEKGFSEMLELLGRQSGRAIDVFGDGDAGPMVKDRAATLGVSLELKDVSVRPYEDLASYTALINTSRSEVLCTVTAEALAMGKFAVVPRHPSNEYFYSFPNCLVYDTPDEFEAQIALTLTRRPVPFDRDRLSWSRAVQTFMGIVDLPSAQHFAPGDGDC